MGRYSTLIDLDFDLVEIRAHKGAGCYIWC